MSRIPARHWPGPPAAATSCTLRFTGTPAVFDREVDPETGDKKSIYVITADGRLAQLWDTDMWNLDFPADHF